MSVANQSRLTSRTRSLEYDPLRLARAQGARSEDFLPPSFQPAKSPRLDMRSTVIGVQDAAKILKLGRTQTWRYATEGHPKLGILPHEVHGTEIRPEYKFLRTDVEEFAEKLEEVGRVQRNTNRSRTRLRQSRSDMHLKLAAAMLREGKIDLGMLIEAAELEKRKRNLR